MTDAPTASSSELSASSLPEEVRSAFDYMPAQLAGNVAGIVDAGLFKRQYRDHRLEWMIRSGGIEVVLKGLEKGNIRFNEEPV